VSAWCGSWWAPWRGEWHRDSVLTSLA
jgi:hypothetical protein